MQHQINAACYDEKDKLIAQIPLFQGRSFRTFAVEYGSRVHQWNEESSNELKIPITWFSESKSPVLCSFDGEPIGSAIFPNPLWLRVDRPKSYFEKRHLVLSHTESSVSTVLELDLSVVAKPRDITADFRSMDNSVELCTKEGFENVDVRICDSDGQLIDRAVISSEENNQNGKFRVSETKGTGSCYFDLAMYDESTPSHRIIIPFDAEGNQP